MDAGPLPPPMAESPAPSSWDSSSQLLWERGEQQAAIDQLLKAINRAPDAVPRMLGLQLVYYVFLRGDLRGAELFLRRLLTIHPNDAEILENLAVVISRQNNRGDEAELLLHRVCALRPDSANAWDGLAKELARSGRHQEAQRAGERSLDLKTASAKPLPDWSPPSGSPQVFLQRLGRAKGMRRISFSLWGSKARYLRGALRNALLIPDLYPGWQARFYLDASVPEDFVGLLHELGTEVKMMPPGQSQRQKLCWRFLVANDPAVGRFLVRDCDAVVNQREVRAVQQWLDSDRWFHVMRDWWSHTDPILAGMWGGIAGVLPDLAALLAGYSPAARETANVDQWFLRDVLWGSIHPLALVHDRCYRCEGSQAWPGPAPPDHRHVGQNEFAARRRTQASRLAPWIRLNPCLQLPDDAMLPARTGSRPPLNNPVIRTGPTQSAQQTALAIPANLSGRILNIQRAKDRWDSMESQLKRLGWSGSHRRHLAQTAAEEEAKTLGLRNGGELGLWRSTTELLAAWLATSPGPDAVLHVLEDDTVLHPSLPLLVEPLGQAKPCLDVIFPETFLTVDLYRRFRELERRRQKSDASYLLLDGGQYLACSSSYLLSHQGAHRLLQAMQEQEESGRLVPIDMALRNWIRAGRLTAAITLPFFSTINAHTPSSLQRDRPKAVHLSQNADLALRRLMYVQTWEPSASAEILQELSGLLGEGFTPGQIESVVLDMLQTGKAEGWLPRY